MNSGWYDIGLEYINIVFLLFTTGLMVLYSCMGYMSTRNSVHYRNKNSFGKLMLKSRNKALSTGRDR